MSTLSNELVQRMFREYYEECLLEKCAPRELEKREFGALLFKERLMIRHKAFTSMGGVRDFLCSMIPSDVYYSSAYYEQPSALDMSAKGWLGADLIFDIDADHIHTQCEKIHDEWTCGECGFSGKGLTPDQCPVCGGQKFQAKTWLCEDCIESAKNETAKLLDMLQNDFGFSEKEVHVFFSGHRGYHVHVETREVKTFDSIARKEIVDYISGIGLNLGFRDSTPKKLNKANSPTIPSPDDLGWRGRVAKGVHDFILYASPEDYKKIGLRKNVIETIIQNKNLILRSMGHAEPSHVVKGLGPETWRKLIKHSAESLSAKIDTVVTTDIHRLIRLPGTLHSKTGFKKVEFSTSHLEDFDPLKSAVAFRNGAVTIFVSDVPEFRIGDKTFGPYHNQKIELPTAAALLLICKKRAEVVEQDV